MLILISPAKTLDYQSPLATERYTQPELLDYSQQLIREARKLSAPQIASLMSISDKLADLNATRFHEWHPDFTPLTRARRFWRLKVMSIPACRRKTSAKPISILPSSICVCCRVCMAYCVRWI
jgi:hypothetical protein